MLRTKSKKRPLFLELFTLFLTIAVLLPLYFAVLTSLKTPVEAGKLNFALPQAPQFTNYLEVLKLSDFKTGFFNSFFFTLCGVISQIILSCMTAFILGRRTDRISKSIYSFFILGLLPGVFLVPTILVMDKLMIYGTRFGFILYGIALGTPMLVFLFTGFVRTVPREVDESAIIDGCGLIRLFFQIIFQQMKPIIATGSVLVFMATWNDFIGPLVYLPKTKHQTLPMMIYRFNSMYGTQWELLFATLLIVAIPILLFYLLAQKHIVEGMTAGAVKG